MFECDVDNSPEFVGFETVVVGECYEMAFADGGKCLMNEMFRMLIGSDIVD